MAEEELDDALFWLPSEFLTDDDDAHLFNSEHLTSPEDFTQLNHNEYPTKGQKNLSTSPQSTFYRCKSPNYVTSLPPQDVNGLDFLYAAAQQVQKPNPRPISYQSHQNIGPAFWPTLQQMGMRANACVTKERTGTGVFLPRTIQTNTSTRKQPGVGLKQRNDIKINHLRPVELGLPQDWTY